jgi:hypothetical protein
MSGASGSDLHVRLFWLRLRCTVWIEGQSVCYADRRIEMKVKRFTTSRGSWFGKLRQRVCLAP